jgi:hypothetical protein
MTKPRITRREILRQAGVSGALALGAPVLGAAPILNDGQVDRGVRPPARSAASGVMPDTWQISQRVESLLEEVTQRGCMFFWENGDPNTGLVRDRAAMAGNSNSRTASIAATGFGLSALCIAAHRKYLPQAEVEKRVENCLAFMLDKARNVYGFYFHFLDMQTGDRLFNCELSSIDTVLLMCGVLLCRTYFNNPKIEALANRMYRRMDWNWMLNGGKTPSMGWFPSKGFIPSRWDTYAEMMNMYLIAIGSPTFPLPPATWDELKRPEVDFGGIDYISGAPPIFVHQFSHAWCDFRGLRDKHANYFVNSIAATRAHQLFCLTLGQRFPWINQDLWGITASDSRTGYRVWGGPPEAGRIDGTLVPCATGGSLVFLPAECSHVLLSMKDRFGDKVYGRYGFVDAFLPHANWFSPDVIGIDQGITVLMAENLRTGFVWQEFMKNREIRHAMDLCDFHPDPGARAPV